MLRPRFSLTFSILAFLSCLLVLTWFLFSLLAFKTAANDLYSQKGEHARTLLATFVNQLPENLPVFPSSMLASDSPAAVYARKLADEESFIRLTLLDVNGKPVFTNGKEGDDIFRPFSVKTRQTQGSFITEDGRGIIHIAQVNRNGQVVGSAGLILSLDSEKARLTRSRQMLMAYFVINFILLLSLGAFILSKIMVRPINRLLSATEKIIGGQYGQQMTVSGSSELVSLAESFNTMSLSLQQKEQEVTGHVYALEKANTELNQAREEAIRTEKMASIGLLAAGMAHEIGTPLASIMGYAELISGEPLDNGTIQDYARRISHDCGRIDRIVRGLLDFSRPRNAVVESCDILALVERTVQLLSEQGALKGIYVTVACEQPVQAVHVDPHQLQQVLINLALNSRDAMPAGGELAIRIEPDDGCRKVGETGCQGVRIDVLDSGSGISREHLSRVFDPFFTTKEPGKGTGLGLAISARIIEGFGGRIDVRSMPGAGTCFSIWLSTHSVKDSAP